MQTQKKLKSQKSIKLLIATDVHLGHKQNHPIRKNDSFDAFEQVLDIATRQNVDFLLLGGDLFDEVNPSQKTIYKCLNILQYYVQGYKNNNLKARQIGDSQCKFNFQNKNINIKLPIFTIHGNHDYPSNDFGKLSICDLLHVSNYANYFGKHTNLANIEIKPIIIEKENLNVKIALYGLGYIKDNILNELFENKKVKFIQLQNRQDFFCIFVFHQNRYKKGLKAGAPALKCVSSKYIPSWIDLTIWGHQHEAIPKIQMEDDRKIFQLGSTIITSFIQAEAYPKQCLSIQIVNNGQIEIKPIRLEKSYRPMICKNYEISQLAKCNQDFDFYSFLDQQLNKIMFDIQKQFPQKKPIIRIKVQYSGYEINRYKTLQLKYAERVANPDSIITFWKRKEQKEHNDNNVFKALKQKGALRGEKRQIIDQILSLCLKRQQNIPLYYDPRQVLKCMLYSFQKQSLHSQDYINEYCCKQIDKKMKLRTNQIQNVYKCTKKDLQMCRNEITSRIAKRFNYQNKKVNINEKRVLENQNERKLRGQQRRNILSLKEEQLNKLNLLNNFGENLFILEEQKEKKQDGIQKNLSKFLTKRQKNNDIVFGQQQKKEKEIKKISIGFKEQNLQKKQRNLEYMGENMGKQRKLDEFSRKRTESQDKMTRMVEQRQGILKKSNMNEYDRKNWQQVQEQDCCKRAQKTEYNEQSVKERFGHADKMIKEGEGKGSRKSGQVKQRQEEVWEEEGMKQMENEKYNIKQKKKERDGMRQKEEVWEVNDKEGLQKQKQMRKQKTKELDREARNTGNKKAINDKNKKKVRFTDSQNSLS